MSADAGGAHSSIGPSSAERWMACPGSVALSAQCPPQKSSSYAAEGTAAHTLADGLVSGNGKMDDFKLMGMLGEVVKCDGYGITITEEMIDAVIEYRDTIAADVLEMTGVNKPAEVHSLGETRVHVKSVSPDLWGTADHLLFRKGDKLRVYDFKYGKGHAVEAVENKQMGLYALGAMETIAGEAFNTVELIIVQPRAPHVDGRVRRWVAPGEWLSTFRKEAHAAVVETKKPGAKIVAGNHCRWCPAQVICPAIYAAAQEQTRADFSAPVPTESEVQAGAPSALPAVSTMGIDKLSKALDWQDAIEGWFSAVKDRVRELLESGQDVPGYKLVEGRSNRKWVDDSGDMAAARFAATFGGKVYEPQKVLSPAKMEKLVGKGKIDDLTMKPDAGKTVARSSDARRMAAPSARVAFDPLGKDGIVPEVRMETRTTVRISSKDPFALEVEEKREPVWPA